MCLLYPVAPPEENNQISSDAAWQYKTKSTIGFLPKEAKMPRRNGKKRNITRKQKMAAANKESKKTDFAASKPVTIEYLQTPVKSDLDDNEYRAIKLANGLNVVLVSNPSVSEEEKRNLITKNLISSYSQLAEARSFGRDVNNMIHMLPGQASFTMTMDVGSFSDPPEVPCVSKILGNIILKASQNYPQANGLIKFVTKNKGGLSILAGDAERTSFYVFVSESHFVGAIERFVDCFVAPLLKVEDVEEEKRNILQKFLRQKDLAQHAGGELRGKQYLLDSIASSIPGHPGCNLGPDYENKLKFKSAQQVFDEVETFMKRHYSAHRMFVIIEGRLPLDQLESYAVTYFSKIPNNNLPHADYTRFSSDQCFNTPEFRMMYGMSWELNEALENGYRLELNWPMPSCLKWYRSKPQHYLAWIMNNKGTGSLMSYLKLKGWCYSIECGINKSKYEVNSIFNLFNVVLLLTAEGLANRKQVLDAIFSYINLIRREGPQKRIHDGLRNLEEGQFRFDLKNVFLRSFAPLSGLMIIASPVDYLRGASLYLEYSSELIKQCLDLLAPERANIIVYNVDFHEKDSFYDDWEEENHNPPHYRRKAISEKWIDHWKKIEPLPEFNLPDVDDFMCDDYELVSPPENAPEHPTIIHTDEIFRVWYKLDVKFLMRESFVDYIIRSPLLADSPEYGLVTDLFGALLSEITFEDLCPATIAGLNYGIASLDDGLLVTVSGISKKILLLAREIAHYAAKLADIVMEDEFETAKNKLLDIYWSKITQSRVVAREVKASIVKSIYWSTIDKFTAAMNVDFAKFKNLAKRLMENIRIDCLVQGNLVKSDVIENVRECVELLKWRHTLPNSIPRSAINEIPRGTRICRFKTIFADFADTVVVNYYQFGDHSLRNSVMIKFFSSFLLNVEMGVLSSRPFPYERGVFPYVDPEENYGYCVWAEKNKDSEFESISTIEGKIEKYRLAARKVVEILTDKEWNDLKQSFVGILEKPEDCLEHEVAKNFREIVLGSCFFDRSKRELETFKKFAIEDLREGMISLLAVGPGLRKLSVQAVGNRKYTKGLKMKQAGNNGNENLRSVGAAPPKLEFLTNSPREEEKPLNDYITDVEKFKSKAKVLPLLDLSAMDDIGEAIRRDCKK